MTLSQTENTPQNLKQRLEAFTPTEFAALKNAYYYHWVTSLLRSTGWWNLIWGGLTLWFGLTGFGDPLLKGIQTVAGAIIVLQSLWALSNPDVGGIRRFSAIFLAAGIWNILVAIMANFRGLSTFTAILGLAQIWWAYQYLKIFRQYLALAPTKPPAEIAQLYDDIWKTLAKGRLSGDDDYIEFQITRRWWRGLLLPEHAVLAFKKRKTVMVADKADMILVPGLSKPTARWVDVVLKVDIVSSVGKIKQQYFQKYMQWKGEEFSRSDVPSELLKLRRSRRIIRIAAIIILGLILLPVIGAIAIVLQHS